MKKPQVGPELLVFAAPAERRYAEAVNEYGSIAEAARQLNIPRSRIDSSLYGLRVKAATKGYAPEADMTHATVDPFIVKGVSTLYGKDGEINGQWVKTSLDDKKVAALRQAAFEAMCVEIDRLPALPAPSKKTNEKLVNVYTLTDCHVGALCWHREGGADWDLNIAEKVLLKSFTELVASSPEAKVGIVAQLGDFLHQDSISPVTPTSGHLLDADGRFTKVIDIAVKILRRAVDVALLKHEHVVVLIAEGNHDISSSIWLRTMFKALYENEPRVTVINEPLPYYTYQHGLTMLAWHHGHLKKNDQLPLFFAAHNPVMWGATKKRYCHTGHRHHVEEKEHSGMTVLQHSTLAARDAYAARGGWFSERQATAITYHVQWGEVGRITVTPEMVE